MVEVTQALIDRLRSGASMLKQAGFAFDREHRAMTDAADALTTAQAEAEALRAEIERLREALEWAAGAYERYYNTSPGVAAYALAKSAEDARAALSEPMP